MPFRFLTLDIFARSTSDKIAASDSMDFCAPRGLSMVIETLPPDSRPSPLVSDISGSPDTSVPILSAIFACLLPVNGTETFDAAAGFSGREPSQSWQQLQCNLPLPTRPAHHSPCPGGHRAPQTCFSFSDTYSAAGAADRAVSAMKM